MSQYAHLSKPDPEFAAWLEQHPAVRFPPPTDIPAAQRAWIECGQPPIVVHQKSRLPPDAKYRVQDYKVPVDGGEIIVRAVVPGTGEEGQLYPLLIFAHGGGMIFGNVDQEDYFLRNISTELQVTTLNVDYRVAPQRQFPTALNDSYASLKWAVSNAEALSVSLEKGFIVGGCSAGANLAAGLALRARNDPFFTNTPVTGQYLACPLLVHLDAHPHFPDDLLSMEQNKDVPGLTKEIMVFTFKTVIASPTDPAISPVLAPSHIGLPPAFFQICGMDPLRDDGFLYDRLLREAGCNTHMKVYPGLPHVFYSEYPHLKSSDRYEADIREGLRWLLKEGQANRQPSATPPH
ncbi:Alpha/Beta hydrolase protein [Gloeopeniophorella convolvens]|nr:Alpha/Beta hydrolase protein [Gloeopeniophorella convolvens]